MKCNKIAINDSEHIERDFGYDKTKLRFQVRVICRLSKSELRGLMITKGKQKHWAMI